MAIAAKIVILGWGIIFICTMVVMIWKARCPKCKKVTVKKHAHRCANCGHIDDRWY